MGKNNISTPIQLINAARINVGLRPIRLRVGTFQFMAINNGYHSIRRNALCKLMPEFAIKEMPVDGHRPSDMLRDLENGTYVSDHEFVWEWSDDFKTKMIELLANSVFIKL